MCAGSTMEQGIFPSTGVGLSRKVRAITKTKGKPQGLPVWKHKMALLVSAYGKNYPRRALWLLHLLTLLRLSPPAEWAATAPLAWVQKSRVGFSMVFRSFPAWFSHMSPKSPCCPRGAFPCNLVQGWTTKAWAGSSRCNVHFSSRRLCAIFSAGGQWSIISMLQKIK